MVQRRCPTPSAIIVAPTSARPDRAAPLAPVATYLRPLIKAEGGMAGGTRTAMLTASMLSVATWHKQPAVGRTFGEDQPAAFRAEPAGALTAFAGAACRANSDSIGDDRQQRR